MVKNPDLLSRFDAALGRLQSKGRDLRSDRQKPIVQRSPEAASANFSRNTHEHALDDAANALASLWKTAAEWAFLRQLRPQTRHHCSKRLQFTHLIEDGDIEFGANTDGRQEPFPVLGRMPELFS